MKLDLDIFTLIPEINWLIIVRYDDLHNHSIELYNVFVLSFGISGPRNQGQGHCEGNVRSDV
jgi:hypothetical protein